MKTFKMSALNTEETSSPPPPPAPADPSVEAANAAVAAAAAAAAAEGVATQYNDMYPTYNTYLMTRYSDQRYHTPSTYTYGGASASHISAHAAPAVSAESYYRYPDYSRYPYSSSTAGTTTSPRWRRRSYDPDYITTSGVGGAGSRRTPMGANVPATASTSNSRPLSDMASTISNASSSSSVLMRSRSRSRVSGGSGSSDYDSNYLRYVSPSASYAASAASRPISGYIYGHSYVPSGTSTLDPSGSAGGGQRLGSVPPSSQQQPQPPPNYNAMDREVSARIRRYQADPSS